MSRVLILLLALSGSAAAADLLGPPDLPAPTRAPVAEPASIHGFGDREPGCMEWSDSCRTCSRGTDGAPTCSNVGIACQPQEIKCARQKEPAKQ
jgi:hypothetical protein